MTNRLFSFRNPLDLPLTDCTYTIEGPGLQKPKIVKYRDIQANETVIVDENFVPRRQGERKIVCNFNCKEIQGIGGSVTVYIQ